jgi:hypothetical protein
LRFSQARQKHISGTSSSMWVSRERRAIDATGRYA